LVQKGKQIQWDNAPNELQLDNNLLLTAAPTRPESEDTDNQQKQLAGTEKQIKWKNVPNEL
jgi:hypothetical protein